MTKFERMFGIPCTETNLEELKEVVHEFMQDDGWDTCCLSSFINDVSGNKQITECNYDCANIACEDCFLALDNITNEDEFLQHFFNYKTKQPLSFRNNIIIGD